MIQIQQTLLSDEIFEEQFICDLCKCKGQCCVDGESGAPLTHEEYEQINNILPVIRHMLSPEAQALISEQGIAYTDVDGELVTSIINGEECVFTWFDDRSEERRVGKECRSGWWPEHERKKEEKKKDSEEY